MVDSIKDNAVTSQQRMVDSINDNVKSSQRMVDSIKGNAVFSTNAR